MPSDLTSAERLILEAWLLGDRPADLSELDAAERVVRAERLYVLLSEPAERVRARLGVSSSNGGLGGSASGILRLRGATIEGVLRAPLLDVGRVVLWRSLWLADCEFDSPVDLSGAELLSVRLVGCRLPALLGANLKVTADLDLSGSEVTGVDAYASELGDVEDCSLYLNGAEIGGRLRLGMRADQRFVAGRCVRLEGARVQGDVVLDGAYLDGGGPVALDARGVTIGGDLSLQPASGQVFEARGEVSLSAAHLSGDLLASSALVLNPAGRALHCEDLKVESVLLAAQDGVPFRAAGRLNFLSATVGGNFVLSGARLFPGPDYSGRVARGGPIAINLQQLRVSNACILADVGLLDVGAPTEQGLAAREEIRGWFLLSGAHARTLLDDPDGWPAPGYVVLEGLTYERITDSGAVQQAQRRIDWLRLQYPNGLPTSGTFRPQPYEQLVQVLRQHGRREEAQAIAIEQVRMRLAAKVDDRTRRIVPRLLMWISLHGHSSARALISFALFIALGSLLYGVALWGFDQPFVPVEQDPQPTEYRVPFGQLSTRHEEGCPALFVPFFALDAAMPFVDVGQSSTCRFAPKGELRWLWLLLHSTYSVLGAGLSAIVVLTLSGLMRRDRG